MHTGIVHPSQAGEPVHGACSNPSWNAKISRPASAVNATGTPIAMVNLARSGAGVEGTDQYVR